MALRFSTLSIKTWIYNQLIMIRKYKTKIFHYILGSKAPRPNEIILIDPLKIKGHLEHKNKGLQNIYIKTGYHSNAVVGGDWDKDYVTYLDLEDQEVYKSCYNRWVNGVSWEDTPLYNDYVKMLNAEIPNRFKSLQELSDRYKKLDEIYAAVKESQQLSTKPEDMIRISIDRKGIFIWGPDGRHRICIAICAGLKQIPVKIGYIHKDAVDHFQKLRTS